MRLGGNAMVIRLKDTAKLFGITIIACCAVFVCTLFLSYNIDLAAIKDVITTEAGMAMYNAQVLMGKVIAAVSGGCLIATSVVMLLFYVKNYIGTHGKELGILKALGYSNIKIARHFWVFGLSVFVGSTIGFVVGYFYLPTFYQKTSSELTNSNSRTQSAISSVVDIRLGWCADDCLFRNICVVCLSETEKSCVEFAS